MPHHGGGGHGGHHGGGGRGHGGFWGPGVYLGPTYEIDESVLDYAVSPDIEDPSLQTDIQIDEPQLVQSSGFFDNALQKAQESVKSGALDRVFPYAVGAGVLAVGLCFILSGRDD